MTAAKRKGKARPAKLTPRDPRPLSVATDELCASVGGAWIQHPVDAEGYVSYQCGRYEITRVAGDDGRTAFLLEGIGHDSQMHATLAEAMAAAREHALRMRRSGPSLTDARRAELGYGRLTLRLPEATLDLLAVLAHERGLTRAELVAGLVEAAGAAAK